MLLAEAIEAAGITQDKTAAILQITPVAVSKRIRNKSQIKVSELQEIEKAVNKILYPVNTTLLQAPDQVFIPYLEIPGVEPSRIRSERLKDGLQTDRELISGEWLKNVEPLRAIKNTTHVMDGGDYPLRLNNILVVDTSDVNIRKRGIYVYTIENKKDGYITVGIHGLWHRPDDTVEQYYFNPSIENDATTIDALKDVNFKVWGRVIKNQSLTI